MSTTDCHKEQHTLPIPHHPDQAFMMTRSPNQPSSAACSAHKLPQITLCTIVLLLGLCGRPSFANEPDLHLILLAGQSNMAGRGQIEPQDKQPHPRIKMLDAQGNWVPAVAPVHFDKPGIAGVGLARSFAMRYAEANPSATIGLVPCAVGGSSIAAWQPGGYHKQTNTHPLDDAVRRIELASKSGTFKGLLWHQGESDCKPASVASYRDKLINTLGILRKQTGADTLPVLIGGLGRFEAKPWQAARYEIDQIHKQLAKEDPAVEFVWSTGLMSKNDNTHFNSASCREFGRRFYLAFERLAAVREGRGEAELIRVQRIWDATPHAAFTDLIRWQGKLYVVFRQGEAHVSPDGAIRILRSDDGEDWEPCGLLTQDDADLRDPKIIKLPDGSLMLTAAAAATSETGKSHQTLAWFSTDGSNWSVPTPIGDLNSWLWRITWRDNQQAQGADDQAYGVGYQTGGRRGTSLYRSQDGKQFEKIQDEFFSEGYPNESSLAFHNLGAGYCLLRRDPKGDSGSAQLGRSFPPYTNWEWFDLGTRIGGPVMTLLPDGRLVCVVRLYDGGPRTSLCWLDPQQGKIKEFLALPSGGDTSYAGMVYENNELLVSYYSSHESAANPFTSAIYFARIRLP